MKFPIIWDMIIATVVGCLVVVSIRKGFIIDQGQANAANLVSDMSNAGFTSAGFVLTILTILVTFKNANGAGEKDDSTTIFQLFFSTGLYHQSVSIIKNCVLVVLFISGAGYAARLLIYHDSTLLLSVFACSSTIILLSLWRCTLVLSKILKLQREN